MKFSNEMDFFYKIGALLICSLGNAFFHSLSCRFWIYVHASIYLLNNLP